MRGVGWGSGSWEPRSFGRRLTARVDDGRCFDICLAYDFWWDVQIVDLELTVRDESCLDVGTIWSLLPPVCFLDKEFFVGSSFAPWAPGDWGVKGRGKIYVHELLRVIKAFCGVKGSAEEEIGVMGGKEGLLGLI